MLEADKITDQGIRIIAVKGAENIIGQMFGAVTFNGNGSVRAGEIVLESHEIPAAVAMAAGQINDAVSNLAKTPGERESLADEVYNANDLLPARQEALGMAVSSLRENRANIIAQGS